MSLKRLLNPSDDDIDYSQPSQRAPLGWNDYGRSLEPEPALQEQPWPEYVDGLLGMTTEWYPEDFSQIPDESSLNSTAINLVQAQIEQWAAQNIASQTSSVTPRSEIEDEYICYGMISRASVRLGGDMSDLDSKLSREDTSSTQGYCEMSVLKSEDQFLVTFSDGSTLGELNTQLEKALEALTGQQVNFEVLAPVRAIRETIGYAKSAKEAISRVNINVYGLRSIARQIGRELSAHKIYLQSPDCPRSNIIYDNPHILKLPNVQKLAPDTNIQPEAEKIEELEKTESFKKAIATIYSSLKRSQHLTGLEGDGRLKTPLLLHQKEGLDFMSQRENGPIPEDFQLWKPDEVDGQPCSRHKITEQIVRVTQQETGGGILADEMGMGKTLSILALVLRTLGSAHQWAMDNVSSNEPDMTPIQRPPKRSRATLIVASSDLMINEWYQEMDRHFDLATHSAIKKVKYHGQSRETDVAKLCDADFVVTTYHTLASDFGGKINPLSKIEWYRLVLDEAHIIRRQSTGLNRTVTHIKARSRWCLTGTPIQNRLEDIGSLFAFIRVKPFHSMAAFRKYIVVPFEEGGRRRKVAIEHFIQLLDSLCLRRTKDRLHLPEQRNELRLIQFSAEEKEQYQQTKKMMSRAVHNNVGIFDNKSTLGLFQVQLQLRILCNHGTYQQPFSWNRHKLQLLDEREDVESSLGGDGEVVCSNCRQPMPTYGAGFRYRRYTERCKHVLCSECIDESKPNTQQSASSIRDGLEDALPVDCPLCSQSWSSMDGISQPQSQHSIQPADNDRYFRPYGRSSKMEALITDIRRDLTTTKSIVFSCWTHTLDLIQYYLDNASVFSQRIDGECPTTKREKILEDFTKNPHLRVLIMTTGTGAVGLNLAVANRVFLVEPQWNPSVENQAIARALRLGQEQAVQVIRYVVDETVEQEMRQLQRQKLKLAGIAWE